MTAKCREVSGAQWKCPLGARPFSLPAEDWHPAEPTSGGPSTSSCVSVRACERTQRRRPLYRRRGSLDEATALRRTQPCDERAVSQRIRFCTAPGPVAVSRACGRALSPLPRPQARRTSPGYSHAAEGGCAPEHQRRHRRRRAGLVHSEGIFDSEDLPMLASSLGGGLGGFGLRLRCRFRQLLGHWRREAKREPAGSGPGRHLGSSVSRLRGCFVRLASSSGSLAAGDRAVTSAFICTFRHGTCWIGHPVVFREAGDPLRDGRAGAAEGIAAERPDRIPLCHPSRIIFWRSSRQPAALGDHGDGRRGAIEPDSEVGQELGVAALAART